ncbi:MAG: JAB domain-containing protein [Desulfobacteraceae bacterium]|nr:JAB domain-containing protein [Desulfobacteraceae bacterium]
MKREKDHMIWYSHWLYICLDASASDRYLDKGDKEMSNKKITFSVSKKIYNIIRKKAASEGLNIPDFCRRTVTDSLKSGFNKITGSLKEKHINKAPDCLPYLEDIKDKKQEHFVCISLNSANRVIRKRIITIGLLNKTQVHPREIFADAITDRAAAIIIAHSHPSGEPEPSVSDLKITQRIQEAGKIIGINVLDHIIVSKDSYYSFQESKLL